MIRVIHVIRGPLFLSSVEVAREPRTCGQRVRQSQQLMQELADEKLISNKPFDTRIKFLAFDLWHYYGRTAKHGAFMGGADFVQWHGYYEMVNKMVEMRQIADELRQKAHERDHSPAIQPAAFAR